MKLTFLEARKPLRKIITKDENGQITKQSYPRVQRFTSHEVEAKSFQQFTEELQKAADRGWCLFRGELRTSLEWESRAGKTARGTKTDWFLLDLDGVEGAVSPEHFLFEVLRYPKDLACLVHWSSSAGLPGDSDALSCHIFIPVERPVKHEFLRRYIRALNVSVPLLSGQLRLTADRRTFRWPLDIVVNDASRIIYIAPPSFRGLEDPVPERWQLVNPDGRRFSVSDFSMPSQEELATIESNLLVQLQKECGVRSGTPPKLRALRRLGQDWELVENPAPATVTEVKQDRDFIRLNVDGGDSWAYWHPKDDARMVYSFKGMYAYKTRQFLPDYWVQWQEERAGTLRDEQVEAGKAEQEAFQEAREPRLLFFVDSVTEYFRCGLVSPETTPADMYTFARFTTLKSWVTDKGGVVDSAAEVPVWDVVCEPGEPAFNFVDRRMNLFPHREEAAEGIAPDGDVLTFMRHVLGDDPDMLQTFFHWWASIYQTSHPTHTAWLLWGVQGTGKDLLTTLVRRTLGVGVTAVLPPHLLQEPYNQWAMHTLFAAVNEVDTDNVDMSKVLPKLKDYITAERLRIRVMRKDTFEVENRLNFVFCSNRHNALYVEPGDRRFHVPPRQEIKLDRILDTAALVDQLEDERFLAGLRTWLREFEVNQQRVRKPVLSPAKQALMCVTQTARERLAEELLSGDMEAVARLLPSSTTLDLVPGRVLQGAGTEDLVGLLAELFDRANRVAEDGHPLVLTYGELFALFALCVDDRIPTGRAKFRQYLMHAGLQVSPSPVWCPVRRKAVRGMRVSVPLPHARAGLKTAREQGYTVREAKVAPLRKGNAG